MNNSVHYIHCKGPFNFTHCNAQVLVSFFLLYFIIRGGKGGDKCYIMGWTLMGNQEPQLKFCSQNSCRSIA